MLATSLFCIYFSLTMCSLVHYINIFTCSVLTWPTLVLSAEFAAHCLSMPTTSVLTTTQSCCAWTARPGSTTHPQVPAVISNLCARASTPLTSVRLRTTWEDFRMSWGSDALHMWLLSPTQKVRTHQSSFAYPWVMSISARGLPVCKPLVRMFGQLLISWIYRRKASPYVGTVGCSHLANISS